MGVIKTAWNCNLLMRFSQEGSERNGSLARRQFYNIFNEMAQADLWLIIFLAKKNIFFSII